MTDTIPMIAWFESEGLNPGEDVRTIFPEDPALNFAALLIEDYADEWLWRYLLNTRPC